MHFEEAADPVAQAKEDSRPDERADNRARTADDRHERDLDRNLERGCNWVDEAVVVDVKHAREARDCPRNDERHIEMHGGAIAKAPHAALAPFDAAQRQAEWGSRENAIAERAKDHDTEDEVIVSGLRGDAQA